MFDVNIWPPIIGRVFFKINTEFNLFDVFFPAGKNYYTRVYSRENIMIFRPRSLSNFYSMRLDIQRATKNIPTFRLRKRPYVNQQSLTGSEGRVAERAEKAGDERLKPADIDLPLGNG